MISFEEVLAFTHTVGSAAAYEDNALRGLWLAASAIPPRSTILEIGCEYGRSTSLLAQVAKARQHRLILVDMFTDPASAASLVTMLRSGLNAKFTLVCMPSAEFLSVLPSWVKPVHLLHIDGDHSLEALMCDVGFLWYVPPGGFACFHDYGGGGTSEVKPFVDSVMVRQAWEHVGLFHTCSVYRRRESI